MLINRVKQLANCHAGRSRSCYWRRFLLPYVATGESKGPACRRRQVKAREPQIGEYLEKWNARYDK